MTRVCGKEDKVLIPLGALVLMVIILFVMGCITKLNLVGMFFTLALGAGLFALSLYIFWAAVKDVTKNPNFLEKAWHERAWFMTVITGFCMFLIFLGSACMAAVFCL